MNKRTLSDLSEIFEHRIDAELISELATQMKNLVDEIKCWAPDRAEVIIRTRDKNGKILKRYGARCFTFEYNLIGTYTIFAGSVELDPDNNRVPVIRFREKNFFPEGYDSLVVRELLGRFPPKMRFSYKKPNWMCVIVSSATFDTLLELMTIVAFGYHDWANKSIAKLVEMGLVEKTPYHELANMSIADLSMSFSNTRPTSTPNNAPEVTMQIKCPKCGSAQITGNKQGFGLGKAAAGGILFGFIGLLGGFLRSNKVIVTCLKCGHQWKAGS